MMAMAGGIASGDWREATKYATTFYLSLAGDETLPETVKISFNKNGAIKINGGWADRAIRHLYLYDVPDGISINNLINQCYNLDSVVFVTDTPVKIATMNAAFNYTNLKHVVGTLDVSQCGSGWALQAFSFVDLYDISFVAGTIGYSISFAGSQNLTDASIISIANGLSGSASGASLTLAPTPKARCSTLVGINNNGLFVADSSGTLTLSDFITTVKGWTLA